ncbi:MAG: 4'-phosphopantetheinyl transferase superfamily protein [Acidobacteria bacterium]|nr:4'-phosphopantetheinyl transferase superfamily protein [Acidobacteriota bacterium]
MEAVPITSPVPSWRSLPETLMLGSDEVQVWRANLDQTPSQVQSFLHNLAADEQARAERFYFERDREHFIVARGVLRAILGGYLNRAPECLSFCYSAYGKPSLAGESDGDVIRFNVSHSHGIALYAFTRGTAVGIDLERIRFDLAVAEVAGQFFSPQEVAMLRTLPTEEQTLAFFRCWTRKEAYIKARGEGLSLPLDQFDVSLAPGEPAAVLGTQRDPSEASRWSLQELTPAPGFVAALAVAGHDWRLTCWQWPDPNR